MAVKYKKRADGRYSTTVTLGLNSDGTTKRKQIYAKTVRELEEKRDALRYEVKQGTFVSDESITVEKWSRDWLRIYKTGVSYNTKLMYETTVNAHIIPILGQMRLKDVRPHNVQRLINDKISNGNARTAQIILLTLKQIFKKAYENNFISRDFVGTVTLPKIEKTKKRAITEHERTIIENANLDLKGRAFIYTLLYAGLRKGEALALTRDDINFAANTITVSKSLITKGNRPEIKPSPKSKAGNRKIPMPDLLVDTLRSYFKELKGNYVFPAVSGEFMSAIAFRRFWAKVITQLNEAAEDEIAKDITPHIFRHSYATMIYYAGIDIKMAQYLLGHSNINITLEIYTHLDKDNINTSVEKINSFIKSGQKVVSI